MFRKPFQLYPLQKFSLHQQNSASNTAENFFFFGILPSYLPLTCFTVSSKLKLFSLVSYSKPAFQWMSLFPTFQRKQKADIPLFQYSSSLMYLCQSTQVIYQNLTSFKTWLTCLFFFFFSVSNHLI